MIAGLIIVKIGLLDSSDSRVLSIIAINLLSPCTVIMAMQINGSSEIKRGLFLSLLAGMLMQLFLILITGAGKSLLNYSSVERLCLAYPNTGNLLIPLITSMLGEKWIVYSLGFIIASNFFTWSHAKAVLSHNDKIYLRNILVNPNIIAIFAAVFLQLMKVRLPEMIEGAVESLGNMIGAVAMLVTGMILGSMDLRQLISNRRIWMISFGKMIILPLISLPVLKCLGLFSLAGNDKTILMITFLGVCSPPASNLSQLAMVYGENSQYISSITIVSTLMCIITMPLMVMLFQL